MLSRIPFDLEKLSEQDVDKQLLRAAFIAELDAISFYEQLASKTKDDHVKKLFEEVAREEKVHVGEFQSLLLNRDEEQAGEIITGDLEVEEMMGGDESER